MEPESSAAADPQNAADPSSISVGDTVRLSQRPRYLKTADVMPMLRPPDLVDPEEQGQVMAIKPGDQLAVRFRRGTFLLSLDQLVRLNG